MTREFHNPHASHIGLSDRLPFHYESSAIVPVAAERLFEFVDDHASLSAHMGDSSWRMGWSRMEIALDENRGRSLGSHIRLDGKVLGIRLALDEVVTERNPSQYKSWETTGSPRLLVMGHYRMGFEITPQGNGSLLRVFIDYALPDFVPARWLGRLLGRYYAKWCVRQMLDGAVSHFSDPMTVEEQAGAAFVEALAEALDIRERETGLHSKRVACHTLVLARRFTRDTEQLRQIYWGALLHDIGKIGIPDAILLKPGALNEDEWREMRTHPEKGYRIVSQIPGMAEAAEIVLSHEERFDGRGYPRELHGEKICQGARLFAVIDTLDAMTSDRSYRKAMTFDEAKEEIVNMSGTQFDPAAVQAFLEEEAALREMVLAKCMEPNSPDFSDETKPLKGTAHEHKH